MKYVRAKEPSGKYFYHHAPLAAMRSIIKLLRLRESSPYKGIGFTTEPGRFLSALPMLGIVTVDAVLAVPKQDLLEEHIVPCLYRTQDDDLVNWAKENKHKVYGDIPKEYHYLHHRVTKSDIFFAENEWVLLATDYILPRDGCMVFVVDRFYRRFLGNKIPRLPVFPLSEWKP